MSEDFGLLRDYATIEEVATALHCNPRTIRRKINSPNSGWSFVTIAGRKYLHLPTIRKVIESETVTRNPRRLVAAE